jgi:PmbA protein
MNYDLLFDKAKAAGIEDIQIYYSAGTEFDIEVFKGAVEKFQIADSARLSVKGIYNGKMGTVSTEVINEDVFDFLVDSVVASAKLIDSQDEVFIYEGDKEYPEIKGLFNDELDKVETAKKLEDTKALEAKVMALDERLRMVQAFYGQGTTNVLIQNSKGLKLEKKVNSAVFGAYAIASDGTDQRTAYEFTFTNDYNDFDFEELAKGAAEKSCALLGAQPCESGEYEVVLKGSASNSLLAPFVSMFSADAVQKDVSLLKGKVGEKIASDLVTIVDDPFKAKSPKSGAFDDEGVATNYKELVSKGELTGYMHNLKTAKKADTKSTGNGTNNGVAPSNFYIKPGELKYEDAVASMKKGLIITDLAGTHAGANAISGDFSLQASGFLVEDGKIVRPVALITVAGNYLQLLQDVVGVCDDVDFNFMYIGSPSLLIKKLVVAGK